MLGKQRGSLTPTRKAPLGKETLGISCTAGTLPQAATQAVHLALRTAAGRRLSAARECPSRRPPGPTTRVRPMHLRCSAQSRPQRFLCCKPERQATRCAQGQVANRPDLEPVRASMRPFAPPRATSCHVMASGTASLRHSSVYLCGTPPPLLLFAVRLRCVALQPVLTRTLYITSSPAV